MKIWKPLVNFEKHRKEWAWHSDFALEEGEALVLIMGSNCKTLEVCPEGKELKVHLEICVEPEDKN
jgi:hypothetical protein